MAVDRSRKSSQKTDLLDFLQIFVIDFSDNALYAEARYETLIVEWLIIVERDRPPIVFRDNWTNREGDLAIFQSMNIEIEKAGRNIWRQF